MSERKIPDEMLLLFNLNSRLAKNELPKNMHGIESCRQKMHVLPIGQPNN